MYDEDARDWVDGAEEEVEERVNHFDRLGQRFDYNNHGTNHSIPDPAQGDHDLHSEVAETETERERETDMTYNEQERERERERQLVREIAGIAREDEGRKGIAAVLIGLWVYVLARVGV